MYKVTLLNMIVDEMNICKRLFTKIPADKLGFRPKHDMRSIHELLQYLCIVGTALPAYWLKDSAGDFYANFEITKAASQRIADDDFLNAMDIEIAAIHDLFERFTEDDLFNREVSYPWGGKAALGEAIIATSIKFLTGYKLQLFLYIRMCTDQKLGTPDAWFRTAMD